MSVHDRTWSWGHVWVDPHSKSIADHPLSHCWWFDVTVRSIPEAEGFRNSACRVARRRTINHNIPNSYSPRLDLIGPEYLFNQVHSNSCRYWSVLWQALLHHATSETQALGQSTRPNWRAARRLQAGLLQIRSSLDSGSSTTGMTAYGRSTRRQVPFGTRPDTRNWRPLTGSALSIKCGWIQSDVGLIAWRRIGVDGSIVVYRTLDMVFGAAEA